MTHKFFSTNLTMSPQIDDFLKKAPFLNLSSYCSGSVSVTIRIIKQKTQSDKPVGLTWLWSSVEVFLMTMLMITAMQVGPGDGYVLTVGGFNEACSTLGDSMVDSAATRAKIGGCGGANGMKFTTK